MRTLFVRLFLCFIVKELKREKWHLYPGIGDPWAGHRRLKEFPNSVEKPVVLSGEGNFGTEPPTGSERGATWTLGQETLAQDMTGWGSQMRIFVRRILSHPMKTWVMTRPQVLVSRNKDKLKIQPISRDWGPLCWARQAKACFRRSSHTRGGQIRGELGSRATHWLCKRSILALDKPMRGNRRPLSWTD